MRASTNPSGALHEKHILIIAALLCGSTSALADSDESKVNGSITIMRGKTGGDLSTVNGSILVGDQGTVKSVKTVDGSISIGTDVKADSLETVNGAVEVGGRSRIDKDIQTVDGRISLRDRVEVGGSVENVNGDIRLAAARVAGRIKTTSGNITIGVGANVGGGILVDKPSGSSSSRAGKPPRIVIGPTSVVEGTLEFRRKVELLVSDGATIGTVKGAKVKRFSGDMP